MVRQFLCKVLGVATLFACAHAPVATADSSQGEVARIWINASNVAYFRLKGDRCKVQSSAANPYWTFSLNTSAGKAWYEMLLASAYAKRPVIISTPTCSPTTNQAIRYVYQDYGQQPVVLPPIPESTPEPTPEIPDPAPTNSPVTPPPEVTPPVGLPTVPGGRPNSVFN